MVFMKHKPKSLHRLRLADMLRRPWLYDGLRTGLNQLPTPESVRIGWYKYPVPQTLEDFGDNITYGQRMYFATPEPHEYGIVVRYIAGYFYTVCKKKPWNENNSLSFGSFVLKCKAAELFPVALKLVQLMAQVTTREVKLLQREPTKQEKAAGVERLAKFGELSAVLFLCESFKCTEAEVMQKPYNDCLVRFMLAKEQAAYADRLAEIYRKEAENKTKHK